jgi:hypothetical protein
VAALGGGDGPYEPGGAVRQTRAFRPVPAAGGVGGAQLAPSGRGAWSAWLGLFLLGCLTEWLQQFVPGRGASVFDLAADVAGASLGLWWVRKEALRPVGGPA